MKTLDLEKLYNVLCTVMGRQHLLEEDGKYFDLLSGQHAFHSGIDFESFVLEYSFSFTPLDYYNRTGVRDIVVSRAYYIERDYEINEEICVPIQLLSLSPVELEEWIENRIKECEAEEANNKEHEIQKLLTEIGQKQQQLKRLEDERGSRKIN